MYTHKQQWLNLGRLWCFPFPHVNVSPLLDVPASTVKDRYLLTAQLYHCSSNTYVSKCISPDLGYFNILGFVWQLWMLSGWLSIIESVVISEVKS